MTRLILLPDDPKEAKAQFYEARDAGWTPRLIVRDVDRTPPVR